MKTFLVAAFSLLGLVWSTNAPAYDGKYHGLWYPIGQTKTPFAKPVGRLFNLNGKTQFFAGANAWWLPRLRNNSDVDLVLKELAGSNLKVVRSWAYATFNYTPPVDYGGMYQSWFQLINETGTYVNYGQSGLARLDYLVHSAENHGLALVLPLVDYNGGNPPGNLADDLGGIDLYQNVYGCNETEWYTSTTCQSAYRSYVETIVLRYKKSPAIFAWEIMNEPRCHLANGSGCDPNIIATWAATTSKWIKSLDPNHMVTLGEEGWFCPGDGYGSGNYPGDYPYSCAEGIDFVKDLALPDIDYGTVHCYPQAYGYSDPTWGSFWIKQHDEAGAKAGKPVVIEEYGTQIGPTNHTGEIGWQTTILKNTEIAMDSFWDFATTISTGVPYSDSASIFYNDTQNYTPLVRDHAAAMLNKKVPRAKRRSLVTTRFRL